MIKRLLPYALLFLLTGPNGKTFLIAGDDIGVILRSAECVKPAQTEVRASTGTYCVQETLEDVWEKIKIDTAETPAEAEEEPETK